jgi:site-specific DNA-methyltransferase (adenine-specific)
VPKLRPPKKSKPLYRQKVRVAPPTIPEAPGTTEIGKEVPPSHFTLKEDGEIEGKSNEGPRLVYRSENPFVRLYQGNCLELLDAIAEKHPEGRFDCIFADPPYILSNGGITCHAGKMVKVDKGDWDKSQGITENHNFNREWLRRCQRVLKPNGTLWVTGTHHVIFSIGFAMQELGFKILNDIAWEKPNPPPNLSCRYFTHSTETILWAAKTEKSKHVFNYQEMRKVTGKQMKTVWRKEEFQPPHRQAQGRRMDTDEHRLEMEGNADTPSTQPSPPVGEKVSGGRMRGKDSNKGLYQQLITPYGKFWTTDFAQAEEMQRIWTMSAPGSDEKTFGKHPTQKPVALIERCLLASTNVGDLVLDPFMGGGTTAVVCVRLRRRFVGIEMDRPYVLLAFARADAEAITEWLRDFRVRVEITFVGMAVLPRRPDIWAAGHRSPTGPQKDLDLFSNLIDRSAPMADKPHPEPQTERIFHETKFVFLSCAQVDSASVVHTTVDVSLQEAWAKTPNGKRRETTHVVRCETEIVRIKSD